MPSLFHREEGYDVSIPIFDMLMLVDFHPILRFLSRSRAFRSSVCTQEKVTASTRVHSVRLELTTLTLVATRFTY